MPLIDVRERALSGHALVWSLFASGPQGDRDFLWRENKDHVYYLLSARPPVNALSLFDMDEPRAFAPNLEAGDRLVFSPRANPVIRRECDEPRRSGGHKRVKKIDVVMNALHEVPKKERAERRKGAIREAGLDWFHSQGKRCGFAIDAKDIGVEGYETLSVPRPFEKSIRFSVLDLCGRLTVTEPSEFLPALVRGFGSAKAFGCGLMLIRRDA